MAEPTIIEKLQADLTEGVNKVLAEFAGTWKPGRLGRAINIGCATLVKIAQDSLAINEEKKAAVVIALHDFANRAIDAIPWPGPDWAIKPAVKWFVNLGIDETVESIVTLVKHPETV